MPRWSASLRSPVFHLPPLMNCTTPTRQPRAQPRAITPKAAEDFPLPCPVLRRTTESARVTASEASPGAICGLAKVGAMAFEEYVQGEIVDDCRQGLLTRREALRRLML